MHKATLALMFILSFSLSAQSGGVEKLLTTTEVKRMEWEVIGTEPTTLVVDEVEQTMHLAKIHPEHAVKYFFMDPDHKSEKVPFNATDMEYFHPLGKYLIGSKNIGLLIRENNENKFYLRNENSFYGGISFILKLADQQYIAFFINKSGAPGAADTRGKVYKSDEALTTLKVLDPEKFELSRKRARELGLEERFLSGNALVWGDTYYDTPKNLKTFWNKSIIYPDTSMQIQYDSQGYGYMTSFNSKGYNSSIWIVDSNANLFQKISISEYSQILPNYEQGQYYASSVYVGLGGNIYFYVAGQDFTEIFRIRRTWGDPDMYALAINGYTKDAYGQYVDNVLEKMSKGDLRLLRNHVFALYGYVFKDAALNGYFDKQVWYLAKPEVNLAGLTLPEERKALVDRVLEEEKKR